MRQAEQDQGELFDLLRGFQIAQERRGLSPLTIEMRRYHLRRLAKFIQPESVLNATTEEIHLFLDGRKLTPKTRHSYLCSYRAFFKWATREGITEENPVALVDMPRLADGLPRPIADADLAEGHPPGTADDEGRNGCALDLRRPAGCVEIGGGAAKDILDRNDPPMLLVRKGKGRKTGDSVPLLYPGVGGVAAARSSTGRRW